MKRQIDFLFPGQYVLCRLQEGTIQWVIKPRWGNDCCSTHICTSPLSITLGRSKEMKPWARAVATLPSFSFLIKSQRSIYWEHCLVLQRECFLLRFSLLRVMQGNCRLPTANTNEQMIIFITKGLSTVEWAPTVYQTLCSGLCSRRLWVLITNCGARRYYPDFCF